MPRPGWPALNQESWSQIQGRIRSPGLALHCMAPGFTIAFPLVL